MALLREIQETGSKAARDKLIQGNLRLVLSVIQRFTGRGEDMEDLFQVGVVGLIKAINHFDLSKEVRFSTYCVPMISGELRRYLRDFNQVKVSRSLRDLAYKAMQAKERLTGTLQREPTIEQIATEIGAKREDVVIALESITDPVSLYEPVYSDSGDTLYVMDQISDRDSMENWLGNSPFGKPCRDWDSERKIYYICDSSEAKHKWKSPEKSASHRHRFPVWKKVLCSKSRQPYNNFFTSWNKGQK